MNASRIYAADYRLVSVIVYSVGDCMAVVLLLAFFVGVRFCVLYDYWWAALGCIAGFNDSFIRHPPSFHRRA
jgi:hypothetical protein